MSELTTEELAVIDMLASAYNLFVRLPRNAAHPSDNEDFGRVIHQAQHFVMARVAVRGHPDKFVTIGEGVSMSGSVS